MVFSSITFVYAFFPLVAVAYYLSKNRVYRNVVLLLASLLFYSWGEPRFLLLMLAATLAAYCGGLLMERSTAHKRLILIVTVVLLVGNLFVFKYLNFFSENLSALFGWSALPKLTLPIGISFYTFQILSYVIDLYRGEIRVQRNYFYLLLYVSFFPQLIAMRRSSRRFWNAANRSTMWRPVCAALSSALRKRSFWQTTSPASPRRSTPETAPFTAPRSTGLPP